MSTASKSLLTEEEKKKKTAAGDPLVKDYSDMIRSQYAAAEQAALAGLEQSYQNSMADLDRQAAAIPGTYNAARNRAAAENAKARRNFDVSAAAAGLGAGTGAQAKLAYGVTLQNELGQVNRAQSDALADVELERTRATNEYTGAVAKEKAENEKSLAERLYEESVRVDEATAKRKKEQEEQAQRAWENAFAVEQYNNKLAQQNWDNTFEAQKYADQKTQQQWENDLAEEKLEDQKTQQNWENAFAEQKYQDSKPKVEENGVTVRARNIITGILNTGESAWADKIIEAYDKHVGLTEAEKRYLLEYFEDDIL